MAARTQCAALSCTACMYSCTPASPCRVTARWISAMPRAFAASCARRSDVLRHVACRPGTGAKGRAQLALAQHPARDQLEAFEQDAFLFYGAAERWHRPGCHAADVGVMSAGGDEEIGLAAVADEH